MSKPIEITYLFDPLCGWCYGASAMLEKLAARLDVTIELAPTGLFASDGARPMDDGFATYAWTNDQRISRLTGQPFSEDYRSKVVGDRTSKLDSGPATLALTAVAIAAPEREFEALKAIQKTRYVEGRTSTDIAVLSDILHGLRLHEAADRLAASDPHLIAAHRKRTKAARAEMRAFGADGVPTLIAGIGDNRRIVRASAPFRSVEALVAELQAT